MPCIIIDNRGIRPWSGTRFQQDPLVQFVNLVEPSVTAHTKSPMHMYFNFANGSFTTICADCPPSLPSNSPTYCLSSHRLSIGSRESGLGRNGSQEQVMVSESLLPLEFCGYSPRFRIFFESGLWGISTDWRYSESHKTCAGKY